MAEELKVGANDRITIIITGTQGQGAGRATRQVDYSGPLTEFLNKHGEQAVDDVSVDVDSLKSIGKQGDAVALQAAMNKLSAQLLASSVKPLPQRIVDATCAYLVAECDFIISESDPGTDKFYIAAGDLTPQMISVPGDGTEWLVAAAAPFGQD